MTWLVANLTSILCAVGSILLAYHDKAGWGWFLFGAIICQCGGSNK